MNFNKLLGNQHLATGLATGQIESEIIRWPGSALEKKTKASRMSGGGTCPNDINITQLYAKKQLLRVSKSPTKAGTNPTWSGSGGHNFCSRVVAIGAVDVP